MSVSILTIPNSIALNCATMSTASSDTSGTAPTVVAAGSLAIQNTTGADALLVGFFSVINANGVLTMNVASSQANLANNPIVGQSATLVGCYPFSMYVPKSYWFSMSHAVAANLTTAYKWQPV